MSLNRFRWVVCQFDRLRRNFPSSIRRILADLPESLDETYEQTLLGIDKEKRIYAQRLFRCLSVSIRPLRVEELAEILAVESDSTAVPSFNEDLRPPDAEEALLSACSSLIAIVDREGGQIVQFTHFSVKEYLTSDRLENAGEHLSFYHILPEPAHTLLAHVGLGILLRLDDKIDKNTIDQFPLAPYAARHWIDHAKFRNVSSQVEDVMERLFDSAKPHFAAWIWLYDIDRYWMDPMSKIRPTQPEAVPLYHASWCGFRGLVERLLISHSPDIKSRGGTHSTPLHAATVKGHVEVASLLLERGADPNSRDDLGRVPLHGVSQGGQLVTEQTSLRVARFLVNSGADVDVADDNSLTPLHAAAQGGFRDIAELLLESGARLDAPEKDQKTALHLACGNGRLEVSRFLIERGSDLKSRDNEGFIPLHSASRYGHLEVARLLLDCGSDVNVGERQSWTPLHYALRNGYLDLARLLIDRSADVNARDNQGWSPLRYASRYGYLDIAQLSIDRGVDVNAPKDNRWTPMHLASSNGHLEIAMLLVQRGATVDSRNDREETPLYCTARGGHLDMARFWSIMARPCLPGIFWGGHHSTLHRNL